MDSFRYKYIEVGEIFMDQKWKLIFEDRFVDLNNWVFDIGSGKKGLWGNNEKEFYTSDQKNCFIQNNQLNIISLKEEKEDCNYTSARLKTLGKFEFKYGYVEVRAKLPSGEGSWPAIWMMGVNDSWPLGGEIDIMEHLGRTPDIIHHAIHAKNHICEPSNAFEEEIKNVSTSFNTYGLLWKEDLIEFYVNRELTGRVVKKDHYSSKEDWPFNDYFYLLINCAVGGDWAGKIKDSDLPYKYIIDYVKIWQEEI